MIKEILNSFSLEDPQISIEYYHKNSILRYLEKSVFFHSRSELFEFRGDLISQHTPVVHDLMRQTNSWDQEHCHELILCMTPPSEAHP